MKSAVSLPVIKIAGTSQTSLSDTIAIEEPLEIRLAFWRGNSPEIKNLAVTMRTPGNDPELALGFLFTEGIITNASQVQSVDYVFAACSEDKQNVIQVTLNEGIFPNLQQAERNFYTTSSCGVCGKASINAIRTVSNFTIKRGDEEPIRQDIILSLPATLLKHQEIFADTGGLHAAALFNKDGGLILVKEDVGRHNALDKLIGASIKKNDHSLEHGLILLSGRASFELVQKAAMAGIPFIAAVGAPSSLAVSLAEEFGITLVGFLRNDRFNIYSAAKRVKILNHENSY